MPTDKKICKECKKSKPIDEFPLNSRARNGKRYRRCHCRPCHNSRRNKYGTTSEAVRRSVLHKSAKARRERAANERTEYYIWADTRASDRKENRENNLTKEFIAELIAKGCSYCGETELRMTLDRIDNDLGHVQDNVVPACTRCNYVRKDMPYEAWIVVSRAMRRARNQDLFGEWTGRARRPRGA